MQFSNVCFSILAVPRRNPYIVGQKSRYSLGEVVDLNCTSNASLPAAELSWYVNSKEVRIIPNVLAIILTRMNHLTKY